MGNITKMIVIGAFALLLVSDNSFATNRGYHFTDSSGDRTYAGYMYPNGYPGDGAASGSQNAGGWNGQGSTYHPGHPGFGGPQGPGGYGPTNIRHTPYTEEQLRSMREQRARQMREKREQELREQAEIEERIEKRFNEVQQQLKEQVKVDLEMLPESEGLYQGSELAMKERFQPKESKQDAFERLARKAKVREEQAQKDQLFRTESELPFRIESPEGQFRDELVTLGGKLNSAAPDSDLGWESRELGLWSVQEADHAYVNHEVEQAQFWSDLGKEFLDIALGLNPATGLAQSFYELTTGRSVVTGEDIGALGRSFAFAGVVSGGGFKSLQSIGKLGRTVVKGIKRLSPFVRNGQSVKATEMAVETAVREGGKVLDSAASLAHTNPDLGRKLDYVLGKATGSAHNVERSKDMLRQMERIGFPESQGTRTYLADHLKKALNDPSSVLRTQENGRVVRESLLTGPRGTVKVESVWEDSKLITVGVFGKGTGFRHGQ